jgi:predicted transcriptional regulator
MRLSEVVDRLELAVLCGHEQLGREVRGGYASDLMSDVIGNAGEGAVWVTVQTHLNVVAIAVMKDLAAIVLAGGREPEPETLARARDEGVPLLASRLPAFEVAGRLYGLGLRGGGREGV